METEKEIAELIIEDYLKPEQESNLDIEQLKIYLSYKDQYTRLSLWMSVLQKMKKYSDFVICLKLLKDTENLKRWQDIENLEPRDEGMNENPYNEDELRNEYKKLIINSAILMIYAELRNDPEFQTIYDLYKFFIDYKIQHSSLKLQFNQAFRISDKKNIDMGKFYNQINVLMKDLVRYSENYQGTEYLRIKDIFLSHVDVFYLKCKQMNTDTSLDNLKVSFETNNILMKHFFDKNNKQSQNEPEEFYNIFEKHKSSVFNNFNELIDFNIEKFEPKHLWIFTTKNLSFLNKDLFQKLEKRYDDYVHENYIINELNDDIVYENKAKVSVEHENYKTHIFFDAYKGMQVAIKRYSKIKASHINIDAVREAHLLEVFSNDNPNDLFMTYYGFKRKSKHILFVLEKCDSTLNNYIKDLKENGLELNFSYFLKIAESIAKAIYKMKIKGVVHRDIKPGNIFLNGRIEDHVVVKVKQDNVSKEVKKLNSLYYEKIKLGDFSVSDYVSKIKGNSGTKGYKAPELNFNKENVDWYKCDIFSFGVTLMEFILLMHDNNNLQIAEDRNESLALKAIDHIKNVHLRCLLSRMINRDPLLRPGIEAVIGYIQALKLMTTGL